MNYKNSNNIGQTLQQKETKTSQFDTEYEKLIDNYIKDKGLDQMPNHGLIPAHARLSKLKEDIKKQAEPDNLKESINLAFMTLIQDGKHNIDSNEYKSMIKQFIEAKKYLSQFNHTQSSNENFRNKMHFNSSTMETIFKIAQYEYTSKNFAKSQAIFTLLSLLEPKDPDYWFRLGIVTYQLQSYEFARRVFYNATLLKPDFIEARIFLAECLIKLKQTAEAIHEIDKVSKEINKATLNPIWQEMFESIKNLLC